jgi:hypothetical protein
MTKRVMRFPTPTQASPGGITLSDSEKTEAVPDNVDAVSTGNRSFGPDSY